MMADVGCDESSCSVKTGRKSYTIQKKTEVLARLAQCGGNLAKTARECGVPRRCIQDWVKAQDQIEAMKNDREISERKRRKFSATAGSDGATSRARYPDLYRSAVVDVDRGTTCGGHNCQWQMHKAASPKDL